MIQQDNDLPRYTVPQMATTPIPVPAEAQGPCVPRELLASPIFLLGRLGYAVKQQVMEEFEAGAGFNAYGYSVLALLDEGAQQTQSSIADTLRIDRSQLVGILDELEEKQLVERRRDQADRRRHLVDLTPAGRRQLTALRKLTKRIEDEILAPLSEDERAQLRGLLLRVAGSRDARYVPPELRAVATT
jgi:DNA-binding MarR family transcriptional regulator